MWSSDRYKDDCVPSSFHKDSARDQGTDAEQAMATSQEVDEFNFSDSEKETGYYYNNPCMQELTYSIFHPK